MSNAVTFEVRPPLTCADSGFPAPSVKNYEGYIVEEVYFENMSWINTCKTSRPYVCMVVMSRQDEFIH